jgi:catechol 2,3-dioxygenase-like lactoylglutathione lyase family enzyme
MPLTSLEHCAIRTVKLEETKDFYTEALGLRIGDRPDFPFPGYWLYLGDTAVVHLVGIDPDDPQGLVEHLGEVDIDSLDGTGSVDHIAFNASDAPELLDRLKRLGVPLRERRVPSLKLFQIFVDDPNGVTIEVNYFE